MTYRELKEIVVRETFRIDPSTLTEERFAELHEAAVETVRGESIQNGVLRLLPMEERDAIERDIQQALACRIVVEVFGDSLPPDMTTEERTALADDVLEAYEAKMRRGQGR